MSNDITSLENELRTLRPAALDDAMMERLEACAADAWDALRPLEMEMEHRLRADAPASLGEAMMDRLMQQVAGLPFPESQPKILPFPAAVAVETRRAKRSGRWISVAAAVALMGALAGWFLPHASQPGAPLAAGDPQNPAGNQSTEVPRMLAPAPSRLVPAGYNRGLSEASDEGVVLNDSRQPHRVLKFVYRERVTYKDADGRTYQVDQPRVEYLIVPAKAD